MALLLWGGQLLSDWFETHSVGGNTCLPSTRNLVKNKTKEHRMRLGKEGPGRGRGLYKDRKGNKRGEVIRIHYIPYEIVK